MNTPKQEPTFTRGRSAQSMPWWKRLLQAMAFVVWLCLHYWKLTLIIVAAVLLAIFGSRIFGGCSQESPVSLHVAHADSILASPEEVRAIRDIGQWEFLAVQTEELVELHEEHLLGDKHLVRVYGGTLRIGIDMSKAADDWFTCRADTAFLRLPDVRLLDEEFIDEARSRSFYEKGKWDAKAKRQLYEKARKAMKARTLTKSNLDAARRNAREQFDKIFKAFGYNTVEITFVP